MVLITVQTAAKRRSRIAVDYAVGEGGAAVNAVDAAAGGAVAAGDRESVDHRGGGFTGGAGHDLPESLPVKSGRPGSIDRLDGDGLAVEFQNRLATASVHAGRYENNVVGRRRVHGFLNGSVLKGDQDVTRTRLTIGVVLAIGSLAEPHARAFNVRADRARVGCTTGAEGIGVAAARTVVTIGAEAKEQAPKGGALGFGDHTTAVPVAASTFVDQFEGRSGIDETVSEVFVFSRFTQVHGGVIENLLDFAGGQAGFFGHYQGCHACGVGRCEGGTVDETVTAVEVGRIDALARGRERQILAPLAE